MHIKNPNFQSPIFAAASPKAVDVPIANDVDVGWGPIEMKSALEFWRIMTLETNNAEGTFSCSKE